ncbi:dentin sialophosphoprotein-like [Oryza brachyantha]|uniref:Uncharacterized protein n=1 Tax=Oryza brachyantha TaxID=4533 RepID=J3LE85_ORYBR|nr:dentin sialophosphoprotein-like [Oryza brachyantha]
MVEASKPTQDMIEITGHVVHDDVSYDKDVLEIKLPDTVVTSDYGGNFVKDVCIDEGVLPHRKKPEEKKLDEKSPPNFDFLMIDANCDLRYEGKGDGRKYAHELKQETALLPVGLAADDDTEKQCDLEGKKSNASFASDISEKKISLQELLKLESAEESQERLKLQSAKESKTEHQSTTIATIDENHMPPVHGEAIEQVSVNDSHDVATASDEFIASDASSNGNTNGSSATISDRHDATTELDKPISTVEVTQSLSGSKEFNQVGTAEARPDPLTSSSSSEVQPSEKTNNHCESITSEPIADAQDENAVASSSSPHVAESSDANSQNNDNNSDNDGATDACDFNKIDEENCTDSTNERKISKSSTDAQKESANAGELDVPDNNAKGKCLIGNGYPLEQCSFGPSIMCNPVSTSGYIGNVSIRSDSSTTSTRSFAFPVLQWDWSSSPVRMAKAERRRAMRHRGWKKGKSFLCWKF